MGSQARGRGGGKCALTGCGFQNGLAKLEMLTMQDFLFYLFAALALMPALLMVTGRNPVNAAMFMILSLVSVAGLFVLLNAFFLAVLQVLVYAGAVMVLFLFVIMLLDTGGQARRLPGSLTVGAALSGAVLLGFGFYQAVMIGGGLPEAESLEAPVEIASGAQPMAFATSPDAFGYLLFTKYMLPFQLAGLLLLVAIVGVVVISKRFQVANSSGEGQS